MSALVLRRLPSGAWALVAVPDPLPVATERRHVREPRRIPSLPFLAPMPAAGGSR